MEVLNILYIVLTAAVLILTVLLSLVLVYVMIILRDVNKITDVAKDTAEKINTFVMQPIKLGKQLVRYAKPIMDVVESKVSESRETAPKKRRKKKSS